MKAKLSNFAWGLIFVDENYLKKNLLFIMNGLTAKEKNKFLLPLVETDRKEGTWYPNSLALKLVDKTSFLISKDVDGLVHVLLIPTFY